jgi:hypothetical protein
MSEQNELNLFENVPDWAFTKIGAEAWAWIHTPYGGMVANAFIRAALYAKTRQGEQLGQRYIWESLRWKTHFGDRPENETYKLCDRYTRYVALFAEMKCPDLQGYFKFKDN